MFLQPGAAFTGVCLVLAACATQPHDTKSLIDFLTDGDTRREEIQLRLGAPGAEYERSSIIAYRLRKDGVRYTVVREWRQTHYNLILVFDEHGVLTRHAIVEVRSP